MNKLKNFYSILPEKLKKNFFKLILLMIFLGFLEIVSIGAVIPVIGVMLDENFVRNNEILNSIIIFFGLDNFSNYIYLTLIFLAFIYVIKSIFIIILTFKKNKLIFNTRVNLSTKLLKFYIRQDYEEYTRRGSYVLINNILKEVPYLVDGVFTPIITIIIEFITFIFIFFLLISYEPLGTSAIFLFFLLYGLSYYFFFTNKTKTYGKIRAESVEKSSAQIIQSINGLKEIKLYLKENFFIKRFDADLSKAANAETLGKTYQEVPKAATEVVGIIAFCILTATLFRNENNFSEIIIKLGFFAAAGLRIMPLTNRIISSVHSIKFYLPNVDMIIYEFNNANKENKKILNEENKFLEFKKIEFKKVNFNYSVNNNLILKNINFEINQGDLIGIQGKSGSGKSTLIDLFTSLLKPTDGKIFVNGIDLKNIENDWKQIIGYVPQDIFISDTTLKNNIAFSIEKNEVDEDHLKVCLEKAQINEFLDQLPDKENTSVGERGLKLSGGQVQRIAIARCLYKKSQILIFDESTNALDTFTEQKILDTIYSLKKEKTIIMISHKMNTLKNCDKILKISNKEIFSENN